MMTFTRQLRKFWGALDSAWLRCDLLVRDNPLDASGQGRIGMFDGPYARRVTRDLKDWTANGWVTPEGARRIAESLPSDGFSARIPAIIGFLGAILLAFAAMTFVAANWDDIPRIWRLVLLVGAMAASYGLAWALARRGKGFFADAAILLGAAIFGAAIMLVAQIYHIESNFPDGVLLWGAGALVAAWLGASRGALILAIGCFALWSWLEVVDGVWIVHWPFAIAWLACLAVTESLRSPAARHLVVFTALGWIAATFIALSADRYLGALTAFAITAAISAALWALGHLLAARNNETLTGYGLLLRPYALAGLLISLFLFQIREVGEWFERTPDAATAAWYLLPAVVIAALALLAAATTSRALRVSDAIAAAIFAAAPAVMLAGVISTGGYGLMIAAALLMLAASIWAIIYGQTRQHRASLNLGLVAFAGETLYLYFETFGELLDTAAFFLAGGVLLVLLAYALYVFHRRANREAV